MYFYDTIILLLDRNDIVHRNPVFDQKIRADHENSDRKTSSLGRTLGWCSVIIKDRENMHVDSNTLVLVISQMCLLLQMTLSFKEHCKICRCL
jgi:hypothetical protein